MGCGLRLMTATVMVLSILSLTTTPVRTLRRFSRSTVSTIVSAIMFFRHRLRGRASLLRKHGTGSGDVAPEVPQTGRVFQLSQAGLQPAVEKLGFHFTDLGFQGVRRHF